MRGIYSNKTEIRHQVFTEVARWAYEGGDFPELRAALSTGSGRNRKLL